MKKKEIKKRYNLKGFWAYFFKFIGLKSPRMWLFIFLQTLKPVFMAAQPFIIVKIVDAFNKADYQPALNLIILFGVLNVATNITSSAGMILCTKNFVSRMAKFNEQWITKLTSHSMSFFQNKFGGSLTANYMSLQGGYEDLNGTLFQDLPGFIVQLIAIIVISALYNPYLGLIQSAYFALFLLLALFLSKKRQVKRSAFRAAKSQFGGKIADIITNILTVKSESTGKREIKLNQKDLKWEYRLGYKNWEQGIWFGGIQYVLNGAFITASLLASFYMVKNGLASSLVFIFVVSYGLQSIAMIEKVMGMIKNAEKGIDEAAPMYEILMLESEIKDPTHPEKCRISDGGIEFNKLKFSYGEGSSSQKGLFSGFSLDIKPGEKIGLVGPSGGGKTTITKLILRFMDVDGGEILIDGQNIASITQDDLRRNITYVPQEPLLFHRTLKENIAYGKPGASEAEIIEVAKKARAHEFITPLKAGYNTLVGERGTKLSGGQRQRVAIARAMLKPAPILILDEATSALDSESEKKIQEALWELMKDKTAIVVAHRLSTIKHMDRIIVIEKGKIKEQGTHAELLKLKGSYANLWQHQSGGFV